MTSNEVIHHLDHGPAFRFADWPNTAIPTVAAGVYTIWDGPTLIYVGMAGRSLNGESIANHRATPGKVTGLQQRLASHASGRRSGDQFCVYVADRLVLPRLKQEQLAGIAAGRLSFDRLVCDYIRARLTYRWVEVPDAATARTLEHDLRGGALAAGRPLLNPRSGA